MPRIDLICFRSGFASDWVATNPQLGEGEPGFEIDTGLMKVGKAHVVERLAVQRHHRPGG